MNETKKQNQSAYLKWLIVACVTGSLAGWILQGILSGHFVYWALPLICLGAVAFTINGDNIIEAIVILVILGLPVFFLGRSGRVIDTIGSGTIPGVYAALALSKIIFALAKDGILGNKSFR